ncbi:hypothetical protein SNE40_002811 [Patella caerulea]|uniref:Uncharacterized protein n=1 Tax=Patella caerulea TaxID=87958 RepID=A0AAN8K1T2_PATCE
MNRMRSELKGLLVNSVKQLSKNNSPRDSTNRKRRHNVNIHDISQSEDETDSGKSGDMSNMTQRRYKIPKLSDKRQEDVGEQINELLEENDDNEPPVGDCEVEDNVEFVAKVNTLCKIRLGETLVLI